MTSIKFMFEGVYIIDEKIPTQKAFEKLTKAITDMCENSSDGKVTITDISVSPS